MARRLSRRASLRETVMATNKSLAMYEALSGRKTPPNALFEVSAPRAPRKPSGESNGKLEKDVQRAVNELLARHPKVLFAVRQNSGSMEYETRNGGMVPVWFYKLLRGPCDLTITDIWGFLTNGKPFAIECKRENWKGSGTLRENKQAAFIGMIIGIGGVGGFVTSADEAQAIIEGK